MFSTKDNYKTYGSNNKNSVHNKKSRLSSSVSKQSISQSGTVGFYKYLDKTPKKSNKSKSRKSRKSVSKMKSKSRMASSYKDHEAVLKKQSSKLFKKKDHDGKVKNYTGLSQNVSSKIIHRKKKSLMASDYTFTNSQYNKALLRNSTIKSPGLLKDQSIANIHGKYSYSKS